MQISSSKVFDSAVDYKAWPLYMTNLSDSLLYVGEFNFVNSMVMQAKTESGEWKDIETLLSGYCATGARSKVLDPHHVLIAKVPLTLAQV